MFDKYHLIHFEIKKSLAENHNGLISLSEKSNSTASNSTIKWSEFADDSDGTQRSSYCWTGNFDMLNPTVLHMKGTDSLYLQSFCIMNNTNESFIRRTDYESLLLSYTYSGEGGLVYNGQTYRLSEGQAFIIDCRKPHEYFAAAENWEHVDIHIWGQDAESLYQHFSSQNIVLISYAQTSFTPLVEKLLDSCTTFSDHRDLFISNALSNLLCTLLDHAEKESNSSIPDIYKYVIRYIESNYMRPLSLDSLSSFANLSKYHFAREFKKYTGFSPNDYLLELRINHACILLINSDLSVEQISNEVGIHNMSNFIRQFKKRTGLTPSALRNHKNQLPV